MANSEVFAVQQNCFSLEYSNALLEVKSTVTAKDSDIEEKNTTIGQVIKTTGTSAIFSAF